MSNAANKKFTELIMYSISLTSVGFCDIIFLICNKGEIVKL